MSDVSLTVRPATDGERERIAELLRVNDLPAADLEASPVRLSVAVVDDEVIGAGGFEVHGDAGLLRSVVVSAEQRGRGYGSVLCGRLENRASEAGVETLCLLTTTATDFFRGREYEPVSRGRVPDAIRETQQFSALCPASATCLSKTLDRD